MENLKQYIKEIIRQEIKIVPKTQFQPGDIFVNQGNKLRIINIEGNQVGYEFTGSRGTAKGSENIDKLKEIVKEYGWKREKGIDEESMSGDAGAYSTPYAFKKQKDVEEIKIQPKTQFVIGDKFLIPKSDNGQEDNTTYTIIKKIEPTGAQEDHFELSRDSDGKKYHEPVSRLNTLLKNGGIKRINDKELDEESMSGDAGAYSTPYAFKKTRDLQEKINKAIKKELISEITYGKFKNTVSQRTKSEQLHKAIREVKRKINEIDRIVEYTTRMKQELSESEGGVAYWQRTSESIKQIEEMLSQVVNKCSNLNK